MKNSIELLRAEVEMKEHEIRKMRSMISGKEKQQDHIEYDPDDFADQFDGMLDESGTVEAGGYSFYPSRILKELDPIAYSISLNNYADFQFYASETDEYKDLQEEIDQLQSDIKYLENEIEDLENEIEYLEYLENQIADLTE